MVKRTPDDATWLSLGSVPQVDTEDAPVSGYWSWLRAYSVSAGKPVLVGDTAPVMAADAVPVLPGPSGPTSSSPDTVTGASPQSFDPPPANPALQAPAAGSASVPRSGNQNIDGVLSGIKWNG